MKVHEAAERILLVCGIVLSAANLISRGFSQDKIGFDGTGFLLFLITVPFFLGGTVFSLTLVFKSWNELKVRSLLPLAIVLAFGWLSLTAPRIIFPGRNARFFEKHFVEYQDSIRTFRNTPRSQVEGDYDLPEESRHLSLNGKIDVITDEGHVNYMFLYGSGWNSYHGALFAPDGHVIVDYEFADPLGDHSGWFLAGYY